MRQILSTDSVSEGERLDYWHHVVSNVFWPLRVGMSRASHYRASVTRDMCGALEVSTVTAQSQFVRRTPSQAAASPNTHACLGLQVSGPGVLNQDGRECSMNPGEAALFDPSRPYSMSFSGDFSLAVFSLPRTLVAQVCGDTERMTARLLRPGSAVAATALSYLSCIAAISTQSGLTDVALSNGTLGIAATLLRDAIGEPTMPARPEQVYQRAVAFIDLNLHEPALSPADVATACHVSLRQLYRVFDTEGQAVAEAIKQQRLARARVLLETLSPDTPVSWIGTQVGFGSAEQFTRAFRDAHGLPPTTWRASQLTPAPKLGEPVTASVR